MYVLPMSREMGTYVSSDECCGFPGLKLSDFDVRNCETLSQKNDADLIQQCKVMKILGNIQHSLGYCVMFQSQLTHKTHKISIFNKKRSHVSRHCSL